jgi:hypothetical protein
MAVSYILSALISCNFIIKNYVNRKITSYIYLLIFTNHYDFMLSIYCTNEKGKCEKNIFVLLPIRTTLVNTSTSDLEKHGKVRQHWGQKRKNTCVRIKRVKTNRYLTYDLKHEIIRRTPLNTINSFAS